MTGRGALTPTNHRTKKEAVIAALDKSIQKRKQQAILGLFGSIDYRPTYDYRRERKRKRR